MKSLTKLLMMVVLTAGSALSQTSAVTATITDPDSQTWNNGTYTINFIPAPNSPGPSTWTGGALTTQFTGSLNSSGVLSVSVADNTTVSPPGSLWQFTLCPNSSAPCQNVRTQVTGASPNLSTTLSNGLIAPRFGSGPFAYGYADVEVVTPVNTGTTYFNVTTGTQRIWNGSAWANNTGGGGAGTVTNIATSGPITGGPLTSTGTIGCATCTTNAAPLTNTAIVTGAGLQASQTPSATSTLSAAGNAAFAGSVAANGTGAALTQVEIADPGAPGALTGSLYWNSSYHRGIFYNNNAGPKVVATWPVTTAGGLSIGGQTSINGIFTEAAVPGNTSSTGMLTEDASGNATWSVIGTIPSGAGLTSNGTSTLVYDTTAGNFHIPLNGADAIAFGATAALAANRIPKSVDSTHGLLTNSNLTDSGTLLTYNGTGGLTLSGNAAQLTSTQGSFATSNPFITHTGTWNAAGVAFNNAFSNITCTASAVNSTDFDYQVGSTSQLKLNYAGANCTTPQLISLGGIILSGAAGAPTTISTSASNASISVLPNGTGAVIFNVGTATNPTYQATGSASNTGVDLITTALLWTATGAATAGIDNLGAVIADNKALVFSQSATANGTAGAELSVIGSGATEALVINAGTSTNLISLSGSACKITVAVTLTTTTTICTWTLPNVAQTWAYHCMGTYSTSAAAITLLLGTQFSQTPTVSNHNAIIWSAASIQTFGSATNNGTTAVTTLTGAAVSTGSNIPFQASGSFTGSATTGTFVIYGTASTTSDATINPGSSCVLD